MNKISILTFILLFAYKSLFPQSTIPAIGQWRVHLPYSRLSSVAVSENDVYAISSTGSFRLDKTDNSINTLSKVSGMSDLSISRVRYSDKYQTFVIGYESGNIDLIKDNVITNVNDISRNTNVVGSKKINHIYILDNYAYLSTDYGVSVLDLQKNEIKESYRSLAPGGQNNPVYCSTVTDDKDSLFLATAKGVMAARIAPGINLLDFNNWHTYTPSDNISSSNISTVACLNGLVYASVNYDGVYYFNGLAWSKSSVPVKPTSVIKSMNTSGNKILACIDSAIFLLENPAVYTAVVAPAIFSPSEALYDSQGALWVADLGDGLVKYTGGNTSVIIPKGPLTNDVFSFCYYDGNMIVATGGYTNSFGNRYIADGYFIFTKDENWVTVNGYMYPSIPTYYRDYIYASHNPVNNCTYVSTFGYGLIVSKPDNTFLLFDTTNSPLMKQTGTEYVIIGGTAVDTDGNTWIVNRNTGAQTLHVLSKNNTWKSSYQLSGNLAPGLLAITIDDYNNKWMTSTHSPSGQIGMVIFNEKTSQQRDFQVASSNLPDDQVNCITKDLKGNIWIGTAKGIAICYDPSSILKAGTNLTIPIYDGFPLLYERQILSIKVDGGNRKWVGTNDGLWLFNEDGSSVISYFTTDNSPLLSNYILDIGINDKTGEVFFATDKGIIAYRGTATGSQTDYGTVNVFPNPVKPDFRGLVGISGLTSDAVVKITDVYGNLCYETKAQGGTAVWNVKDYNGNRARSGVYLVFTSSADGETAYVAKIAVVE